MNCSCHVGFEPTHTLLCSERAVSPFSSSESSSEIRAFGCYPCQARQTISRQILPDKTAAQELAARGLENEPRARGGAKFWLCYIQTRSSLRVKGQNLASQSRAPTLRHRHCSSSSGYWPSCGWMRNSTPSLVACS